ncbi:hypothetical protein [Cellvibrio sp. pealriver]|uniref:hypothetical protein n=1 Tax=Cellvibrio sp. pealriver TaxID=1622269 RepID=UPI00066FD72B|nr:hypothetical protein [Cellvibrio sp. pealriver]
MDNNQNYKERYIAFIDVLGFEKSILNIKNEPDSYEKIVTALTNISTIRELTQIVRSERSDPNAVKDREKREDLRIQAFSDCIVISTNCNSIGLMAVTAISALIYRILFTYGFYARGAITKDLLTHSDNIVFGKGLVQAYSLEQKVAIYPRIILAQNVHSDLSNSKMSIPRKTDFDGQVFLDVFDSSVKKFIQTWNERQSNPNAHINLEHGRTELMQNLGKASETAIVQKLTWLKNYFNFNAIALGLKEI